MSQNQNIKILDRNEIMQFALHYLTQHSFFKTKDISREYIKTYLNGEYSRTRNISGLIAQNIIRKLSETGILEKYNNNHIWKVNKDKFNQIPNIIT